MSTRYTDEQLDNRFLRRELDVESKEDMDELRAQALELAKLMRDKCPPNCLQLHHALVALEEAVFWAEASVVQGGI